METLILNATQIEQKINRIAHQIIEDNYDEKTIVFAGVTGMGYKVALRLKEKLEAIASIKIELLEVILNKREPLLHPIEIKGNTANVINGVLILVDDVLNSGKTLIYALKPFIELEIRKISTVVLVDRSHKSFPIHVDYVGVQLATTLAERIEVREDKEQLAAYLY
jgi:pyrimidine operon attenuation protein / uracil phosphoribosyltransferase